MPQLARVALGIDQTMAWSSICHRLAGDELSLFRLCAIPGQLLAEELAGFRYSSSYLFIQRALYLLKCLYLDSVVTLGSGDARARVSAIPITH
jgi:hypothetical protein